MKINNNIPAYRFQGYTDAWELRKLNNIADVRDGTHNSPRYIEFGYPLVTSKNIKNGQVNFEDIQYISSFDYEEINKRSKVNINDILMGMIGTVGNLALVREEPEFAIKNVALIKNIGVVNIEFLYHYLGSYVIERQLQNSLDGGTQKFISLNKIRHLDIAFPSLPEQSAIGTFFSTLDRHITLHQRKLDTLKEQKKTYLKLLFPAKGQTKPALRFQGFEDDWKEVKLGELCDIRTGKLDANAMVENGEYDFYTSGIKKYRIDVAEFEGPAITIAGNGATVGYMHLADGKFNAYQRTYVLTNFKVDRSYIFSEIAKKLPIKIQQEARTGNIPYIVLSMLTELSISLPTLSEQEAIGTFFQTLDQELAQVEDKLASLKEMKKTLLRKLFV
ncbi:TPA: restriction endonuclease subunit S [Streptococcus suis]|nr:restriction endonuclease subunit S [Streptococcus suis]